MLLCLYHQLQCLKNTGKKKKKRKLQECTGRCTGRHDRPEIMLKTELNILQSINHSVSHGSDLHVDPGLYSKLVHVHMNV